jgi:hypothetical protein
MINTVAIPERERRLMRLPFIAALPYNQKIEATKLIRSGIDYTLLYFWHNLIKGYYNDLPADVLQKDIEHYQQVYPRFAEVICTWETPKK